MIQAAASCYGIDPRSLTPLPGGHFNRVFGFERDDRAFVLRLTPPDPETDLAATRAILAYLKFLTDGGIQVPEPVESLGGQLVETLPDPASPGGPPYLASVFVRAAGVLAEEMPVMVWEDALIEAIGRAVGRFHARSGQYHPLPANDRPHWEQGSNCFNPPGPLAAATDPASPHHWVLAKRAAVLAEIERLPRAPEGYGLIHADLHFGNFYFERRDPPAGTMCAAGASPWSVTILDFDDCAYGWFAMDVAMNLLDAAILRSPSDWDAFTAAFLTPYLRGYRSARPFDPVWLERLPLFLKLLEIGLYLMVADDYNPQDSDSWVGKFMVCRRERIAADLPVMKIPVNLPITDSAGNPVPQDGLENAQIYSANGTLLARGYTRVVVGGRGTYIEFSPGQMVTENLQISHDQEWRINNDHAYYLEHRSRDEANVKVYEQRRTVGYADYRIGMFYVAPADVVVEI